MGIKCTPEQAANLERLALERGGTVGGFEAPLSPINPVFPAIPRWSEMSEKEFQAKVVYHAKSRGWKVYHTFRSDRSEPGFPDLVLVRNRVIFMELKTETGKESKAQREWRRSLEHCLKEMWICQVFLCRPSDWSFIEELLK